ncbi:hypothetical protein NUACC21_32020 [Scytonema sp. NUACC21]
MHPYKSKFFENLIVNPLISQKIRKLFIKFYEVIEIECFTVVTLILQTQDSVGQQVFARAEPQEV